MSDGPFGKVYTAVDAVTGENVIVKSSNDKAMLNLEMNVMKALERRELDGFAQLKDNGKNQETPFLVINRFGRTLQDIMDSRCKFFSLKTVI